MANCYAVADPHFQPAMRLISAITNSNQATVTTSFDHDFVSGTIVRFYVPTYYGMVQLNKKKGTITVTGTDTFTVDINTINFDTFSAPGAAWYQNQCAIVVPVTGTVQDVT